MSDKNLLLRPNEATTLVVVCSECRTKLSLDLTCALGPGQKLNENCPRCRAPWTGLNRAFAEYSAFLESSQGLDIRIEIASGNT